MGERLTLHGRLSMRAPMQWTPYANGGFSTAPPKDFARPILTDDDHGFERISVAAQRSDRIRSSTGWHR